MIWSIQAVLFDLHTAPIADILILRKARGVAALPITQIGNRSVPEELTQQIIETRALSRLTPGLLNDDRLCDGGIRQKSPDSSILYISSSLYCPAIVCRAFISFSASSGTEPASPWCVCCFILYRCLNRWSHPLLNEGGGWFWYWGKEAQIWCAFSIRISPLIYAPLRLRICCHSKRIFSRSLQWPMPLRTEIDGLDLESRYWYQEPKISETVDWLNRWLYSA